MRILIVISFTILLNFTSYSQTVLDKSKTEMIEINGQKVRAYDNKPFSGFLTEHYENGKPKTWIIMKNGLANGLWQEWLENGNLRYDAYWKDGKAQGLWKYFHDNGKLRYEEAYIVDIPNGISRAYFNSGVLQHDFFYLQGKKHGTWSYYSETGILLKQELYENGEMISTAEEPNEK